MTDGRSLYLDLMEKVLLNLIYEDPPQDPWSGSVYRPELRANGMDWPSVAHSMIGWKRMRNVRVLAEQAIRTGIPGDFIETGVWRGGACIMMRAVLEAYGVRDRLVYACDSFEGLPPPDIKQFPKEAPNDPHHTFRELKVSLEEVQENFRRYGLLDGQVRFLRGWFKDTLPSAPIGRIALARLDGDMYQSTMEALTYLYDNVSIGGHLIIDDYGAVEGCRRAVEDFRQEFLIDEPIIPIDRMGVYWMKGAERNVRATSQLVREQFHAGT